MPLTKFFHSVHDTAAPKRERRKDARPGELLDAALDLFVEKGFAATRAEEVAQRAGVSKGTLFLYFASKEELFKAVVREHVGTHLRAGLELLAGRQEPAAETLAYCLGQWWLRYGATKASGITKLMMSEAANFPELAAFYQQEVILPGRALIRGVLQRGVDSGEFEIADIDNAVFIVMAPLMFLIMWQHSMGPCLPGSQRIDPARFLKSQIDILLRGVLAPANGLGQAGSAACCAGGPHGTYLNTRKAKTA
jgi:TetR/AcrR family transcriptional regulator